MVPAVTGHIGQYVGRKKRGTERRGEQLLGINGKIDQYSGTLK